MAEKLELRPNVPNQKNAPSFTGTAAEDKCERLAEGLIVCNFCLLARKDRKKRKKIHPGTVESFSNGGVYLRVLRHEVCLRQLPSRTNCSATETAATIAMVTEGI